MYTAQQIATVIAYNTNNNIFRITPAKRITWDLRNIDVANLQQLNVHIVTAADFAALKQTVRATLKALRII